MFLIGHPTNRLNYGLLFFPELQEKSIPLSTTLFKMFLLRFFTVISQDISTTIQVTKSFLDSHDEKCGVNEVLLESGYPSQTQTCLDTQSGNECDYEESTTISPEVDLSVSHHLKLDAVLPKSERRRT